MGGYEYADDMSSSNGGRRQSDRSQALLSASRSVQSTRSLGNGGGRNNNRPPQPTPGGNLRTNYGRGHSTRSMMREYGPSSDNGSLGGGSPSFGGGGGSSSQPTSVTTGTIGSDTRSTSITMSDGQYQHFPTTRRNDGNMPPFEEKDGGNGNGYAFEEEDDDKTMVSYQTGSSHLGSSIFGGAFSGSSVGGQSEVQREEMLGELRQLLDGEYHRAS